MSTRAIANANALRDANGLARASSNLQSIEKQKKVVLYHYPTSTSSRQARMVLAEKNVVHTLKVVNLDNQEQFQPWYTLLNPKCVVPTLIDLDGSVVVNAKDICHWISHRNASTGQPLFPDEDHEYDMMMDWIERSDDVDFNLLFKDISEEERAEADAQENDVSTVRLRHIAFMAREHQRHKQLGRIYAEKLLACETEWTARHNKKLIRAHAKMLRRTFNDMEDDLEGIDWLGGDWFTLADLLWLPILYRFEELYLADNYFLDGKHPNVAAYYERGKARESFTTAILDFKRFKKSADGKDGDKKSGCSVM